MRAIWITSSAGPDGLLRPVGRLVAYGFANLASGQRRGPVHVLSQVTSMPRIDATYPFAKAADTHRRILARQNTGKIVLTP